MDSAPPPIRAILFDLDGTLVDSLADIADAMEGVLAELGLGGHPLGAYRRFIGEGARRLVEQALEASDAAADAELRAIAFERFRERYLSALTLRSHCYEGVEALLEALNARGLKLAVLSNKPHEATVRVVERLLGAHPFAQVLGESERTPPKPDPRGASRIAETLGVEPAAVLFVGDTPIDVQTARAAGMRPIGVGWGMRDRLELEAAGAEAVIEHPADLLGLLASE